MNKKITYELENDIIKKYKQKPITTEKLAQYFNLSIPTILKILKKNHIKLYTKVQLFSPNLNEKYFDIIDNEYKAYFLGLLITDGCIHQTKGKQPLVSLSLQEQDSYILESFKNCLNSNKTVTKDGRGSSEINILSKTIVETLKKYGLKERKSLQTIFPKNIPQNLLNHFFRGLIDGDGSISYYCRKNRKVHQKAIRFCQGNIEFIKDFIDVLNKELNIGVVSIFKEKENLWSIAYRRNESLYRIINYIYKDAHIYLKRKKYICDLILQELNGNTEITTKPTNL